MVVGLDADGETDLYDLEAAVGPLVVVVGSEGRGLSRLVGRDLRPAGQHPDGVRGRVAQRAAWPPRSRWPRSPAAAAPDPDARAVRVSARRGRNVPVKREHRPRNMRGRASPSPAEEQWSTRSASTSARPTRWRCCAGRTAGPGRCSSTASRSCRPACCSTTRAACTSGATPSGWPRPTRRATSPTRSAASTSRPSCSATARCTPSTCSPRCSPPWRTRRSRRSDFLPPAALTYPAAWGAAPPASCWPRPSPGPAGRGGPDGSGTKLVPEPVAAARYFTDVLRRPVPVGSRARGLRLRRRHARRRGRAQRGQPDGSAVIGSRRRRRPRRPRHRRGARRPPRAGHRRRRPGRVATAACTRSGATQRRDRRLFWDDVRGAKEMLSRAAVAPVAVPGVEQAHPPHPRGAGAARHAAAAPRRVRDRPR